MMATAIASARRCGVQEDFHVWTNREIPGAICHPCGSFDHALYLFKLKFLAEAVSQLDYEYFVFIDADNYFVRHPGQGVFDKLLRQNNWFVQLESLCNSKQVVRGDWWGCPIKWYPVLLRYHGVKSERIYNCNAGFWIVRKAAIPEFFERAMAFFKFAREELNLLKFTEEPPLAFLGHFVDNPELNTFTATHEIWASDWTGQFRGRLPNGTIWDFEDYMSGQRMKVNPAIVHAMRSKDALMREHREPVPKNRETTGFFIGHQFLGDTLGFCAAAHLYSEKIGQPVKVWFDPARKAACDYFDGVVWTPKHELPHAIDCGFNPSLEEWPSMNGVKRFYRHMDPSMQATKSFDIHFNRQRSDFAPSSEQLIGLITHSNTQGDIDLESLESMLAECRKLYPNHKIVLFGNRDNTKLPPGVEDWRQDKGDIEWIIQFIARLDLLITPHSGPCFVAAGWGIPMWVYRSKYAFWDYTLNFENHKVEKWWARKHE